MWIVGILALVASAVLSQFVLYVSSHNYPGGYAMQKLHKLNGGSVHIDVAAAMSGVSRFTELSSADWTYSKEENLTDFSRFDYLLTEKPNIDGFEVVDKELGYDGIALQPPFLKLAPKIFIMKRSKS
jgi:hypothetical protein